MHTNGIREHISLAYIKLAMHKMIDIVYEGCLDRLKGKMYVMWGNYNWPLTAGCSAIIANANARIIVMTMKKTLRPQSWPEGLNQMNRIPEKANAAR